MYRTGADCCLNNLYNNPQSSNLRTTNPMLWSLCGISNPGFCQNTIDSSSAYSIMLQVSVAVTGLSASIAMLVWSDIVNNTFFSKSLLTTNFFFIFLHMLYLHMIAIFNNIGCLFFKPFYLKTAPFSSFFVIFFVGLLYVCTSIAMCSHLLILVCWYMFWYIDRVWVH